MAFKDYLPFVQNSSADFLAKSIEPDQVKSLSKTLKPAALALGFRGTTYYYNVRATFEPSPYNFERILQALDTDSYAKQGMLKYKELFWKEGWKITGENPDAVAYINQRIDFMEIAMKRPFSDFLLEVTDHLIKFSNVFIVKARADMSQYFPTPLTPINGTQPIVGYYIIPTEQVRILRDKHNKPKAYRQQTNPWTYMPTDKDPVWDAEKVIHVHFDKTGRAFGTPFISAALDDIIALRQLEEDIQNLVHRELFPLYKYKIGTADQPAEPEEIERASSEIESMRAEGGLILPFRHDVEVIGANNASLNAEGYLNHFKERVAIGLGVAPHHLGMSMNGGNRAMTDRLDTALYDKVKQYQKQMSEMIRLHFFNELLFEGGFDPIVNPMETGVSDRCYFKFNEIDVDTQVKKETHIIQKYTNSTITLPEARIQLGMDPEYDRDELFAGIQADIQMEIAKNQAEVVADNAPPVTAGAQNSDKQKSAPKGQKNLPSKRKGAGNVIRPANQQGRRTSPNIRRSDLSWLPMIENALKDEYNVYEQDETVEENEQVD